MPFSKTPVNSTYQTKEITLVRELGSRGTNNSRDEYCLNVYPEKSKDMDKTVEMIKRAGSTGHIVLPSTNVRGGWLWKDLDRLFVAADSSVYVYNASTGALLATLNAVFANGTSYVGFDEFLFDDTTVSLVVTDGTTLSLISSANAVTVNVDADMPVHQPFPVVVDGFLFVLKVNSSDIYNSDNNAPLSWTAGNFITAEMRPDTALRISRLNNYIVCFGSKSIEYFYDNANPTGSPLSRNDSPIKSVGYLGGYAQYGNQIYFVGETSESNPDIFQLEDFKCTPIGTDAIRRWLKVYPVGAFMGAIVSFNGHDFYNIATNNATYSVEIQDKKWGLWAFQTANTFPITLSFQHFSTTGYRNLFILSGIASVLRFDETLGSDLGVDFNYILVTDNDEFDSYNAKFINRLIVWADKPATSQIITIQWSDDDFQTYNTRQTLDLFQEMPCIYRCGRFRRRAHKISYLGNQPLRIKKIQVDINMGNA